MSWNPTVAGFAERAMCCVAIAVATFGATACSSIQSKHVSAVPNTEPPHVGMTYYLPMRFAEVTFERVRVASAPTRTIEQARAALATAGAIADKTAGAFESTQARLEAIRASGIPPTAPSYQEAAVRAVDAKLAHDTAVADVNAARTSLTKTIADHQAWDTAKLQCGYRDRFAITLQRPVADVNAKFVAELIHHPTRTDDWALSTTPGGLLSTIEGTIEDQSAEILVALARSAAVADASAAATALSGEIKLMNMPTKPVAPGVDDVCLAEWKPILIQRVIDPADRKSWRNLLDEINRAASVKCVPSTLEGCTPREFQYQIDETKLAKAGGATIKLDEISSGIVYRRELPLQIRITESGDPRSAQDAGTFLLMVPNHSAPDIMPLEASPFVTSTHKLGFDNGILVSVDSNRPSEMLRVAALPWDIASATIDALSQLVQLRVNYTTQNAALVEQQVALLSQLSEQLEAQRRLDATRAATKPDQQAPTEALPDGR